MSNAIDLTNSQRKTVRSLLEQYLPGVLVWAYGSRIMWTSRPESDLDLVAFANSSHKAQVSALRETFEESNLPFRVDLFIWDEVPEKFRKIIKAEYIVIQEKEQRSCAMADRWQIVALDDVKAFNKSAVSMGPFGSNIRKENYRPNGIPVIRGINLNAERFVDDGFVFLTEEKADELSRSNAFPEDIVFTAQGSIGQVGIIPNNSKYNRFVLSQNLMKVTCDKTKVDPLFVFYYFRSHWGQHEIMSYANPTGVPCISQPLTSLRSFRIYSPPLPDQRAIAHILGSLDDKIELNRQMNRTLEAMAQAIFKSWFVDFDPVRAKAEGRDTGLPKEIADLFPDSFENSELGEIPKGWRALKLSEVIEVNPKRMLKKGVVATYLDMKNMPTDSFRAIEWWNREYKSGTRFINGDVLVARITPCLENGKTAFVDFLDDSRIGWGSTEYIVLRSKPPLPLEYTYFLARNESFRQHAIANMTGSSGRQRVPAVSIENYLTVLPRAEVCQTFSDYVSPIVERIKQKDNETRTLAALRDTLLPKLISGKLRVPDAVEFAEAL